MTPSPGAEQPDSQPGRNGAPFFLVDRLPTGGPFVLDGAEGRHAATVRRLRVGEPLVLSDGSGGLAPAMVTAAGRFALTLDVGPLTQVPAPDVRVTLVQALPKGDRGELAVELATEAGVDAIVPWSAHRCVARWRTPDQVDKGVRRWRSTAREAAKQARRPFVPTVAELAATAGVAALARSATTTLVLHERSATPLAAAGLPGSGDVVLIVGPEGGLTEEELNVFGTAGATVVRLGPQVLRTSTAGAVALGALGVLTGRWT